MRPQHYATGTRYCVKCSTLTERAECPYCGNKTQRAGAGDYARAKTTMVYLRAHHVKAQRITHGGRETRV